MSGGHRLERARRLLTLPDGWLEAAAGNYVLRTGRDRRGRVMLTLDETEFRALAETPGLKTRSGGGWTARATAAALPAPAPGRPGVTEGVRMVMDADGGATARRANLTVSPVTWLAARADADGRPWLTRAEIAAAEQLGLEAEAALRGPGVTMRWDALPRVGAGGGTRREPGDAALAAARRVEAALAACGSARLMVRAICIDATPLQAAEQELGLRRRTGKAMLKQGLAALARHYRLA